MLRYDTPIDDPSNRPVRRMLLLVLLMALRDRADRIEFRLAPGSFTLWYRVDGVWYEMVPPPHNIWPGLVTEVWNLARLVAPEGDTGWRWWFRRWASRRNKLAAGWLTVRLHGRDRLFTVRLNPDPARGELILEPVGPGLVSDVAESVIRELTHLQGGDLYVEFDAPV